MGTKQLKCDAVNKKPDICVQYIHLNQHYVGAGRSLSCKLILLWSLVCIKIQERLEQSSSRCTVTGLGIWNKNLSRQHHVVQKKQSQSSSMSLLLGVDNLCFLWVLPKCLFLHICGISLAKGGAAAQPCSLQASAKTRVPPSRLWWRRLKLPS